MATKKTQANNAPEAAAGDGGTAAAVIDQAQQQPDAISDPGPDPTISQGPPAAPPVQKSKADLLAEARALLESEGLTVLAPSEPDEPYQMPDAWGSRRGLELLADACDIYGIDPNPDKVPQELLDWKHHPEDRARGIQEHVALVTAGGKKFRHYWDGVINEDRDPDTATQIRNCLGLWAIDPDSRQMVPLPIPTDLTLPDTAVTGIATRTDHRYERGYMREGGRAEAFRRADARAAKPVVEPIRRRRPR